MTGEKVSREELDRIIEKHGGPRGVDLTGCSLRGEVLVDMDLHGIILRGADLRQTRFYRTDLSVANLQGANLEGAKLNNAKLKGALLDEWKGKEIKQTNLKRAQLISADLEGANLEGAILREANLEKAGLKGAILHKADLREANLKLAELDNTRLDPKSLGGNVVQELGGRYDEARYIYLALKDNFRSIGAYDGAGWAYIKERTMERKMLSPLNASRCYHEDLPDPSEAALRRAYRLVKFFAKYAWKWAKSWLMGAIWGYGQRPEYALRVALVTIAVFAVLFRWIGKIETDPVRSLTLWDYFVYSLSGFTIYGFSDMKPADTLTAILTTAETLMGIGTLAIFTSALGQRIGGR